MMAQALSQEEAGETVAMLRMADRTLSAVATLQEEQAMAEVAMAAVVTARAKAITAKDLKTMATRIVIATGMTVAVVKIGEVGSLTAITDLSSLKAEQEIAAGQSPHTPILLLTLAHSNLPLTPIRNPNLLARARRVLYMSVTSATQLERMT